MPGTSVGMKPIRAFEMRFILTLSRKLVFPTILII